MSSSEPASRQELARRRRSCRHLFPDPGVYLAASLQPPIFLGADFAAGRSLARVSRGDAGNVGPALGRGAAHFSRALHRFGAGCAGAAHTRAHLQHHPRCFLACGAFGLRALLRLGFVPAIRAQRLFREPVCRLSCRTGPEPCPCSPASCSHSPTCRIGS